MRAFFDSNILIYAATADPKKECALACLRSGGVISVQVLNEFVSVARRKFKLDWPAIEVAVAQFRIALKPILDIDLALHETGVNLARQHSLAFYDALIVAAAMHAECDILYSEDMQAGRKFGTLTIVNPFG